MDILLQLVDFILHVDRYLEAFVSQYGAWVYALLFLIIFVETGVVVMPFLPGDSLLFATGAFCAKPETGLNVHLMALLLFIAAVLGDSVNYSIGRRVGLRLFSNPDSRVFRRDYLERTERFYARHGPKAIVIARFVPIIRTFAPFVAGIGKMTYARFALYNIVGAVVWVVLFVALGHAFGNLPVVKKNFQYVILGIIVLSVLPIAVEWWRARRQAAK